MVDMNGEMQATGSRIYRLPDLHDCRQLFEDAIQANIEWEEENEAVAAPQVNLLVDMNHLFPNSIMIRDDLKLESPFFNRIVSPNAITINYSTN